MKYLYILIFTLIIGQQGFAQNESRFEGLKKSILSQYDVYFENIEIADDGKINLYAKTVYNSLSTIEKSAIIKTILSERSFELAIVHYQYKNELWKKEMKNNSVSLIDTWDMNFIAKSSKITASQKTNAHPWFFYLGAGGTYSDAISDINNLNVSTRLGFFLLKNRWDLAASYSLNITGNGSEENPLVSNLGLMTKIYFPIRKINLSPYIGTGISYMTISNMADISAVQSDSWIIPLYLGVSWFVGPGSLDLGFQYTEDDPIFSIGYTSSLWSK